MRADLGSRFSLAVGLPAPRPYPQLTQPGRAWIKAGRYWIAYRTEPAPVIEAVFFETANIPVACSPPEFASRGVTTPTGTYPAG